MKKKAPEVKPYLPKPGGKASKAIHSKKAEKPKASTSKGKGKA